MQWSAQRPRHILSFLAALLLLAGCGGAGSASGDGNPEATAAQAPAPATDAPAAGAPQGPPADGGSGAEVEPPEQGPAAAAEGPREVHVAMVDIAFEPDRIEVAAGEPVELTVTNQGELEHDFDLPAAGLHIHGYPGTQETTVLQIDEPGTYEALCLFPGHAEAGMRLDVVVG